MTQVGIVSAATYLPRLRLARSSIAAANAWSNPGMRGKGHKAMAGWDEDSLTMAVEAGRNCLELLDRSQVDAIFSASTTHPFADRQNATLISAALNLSRDVATLDVGGSLRAGTSALKTALGSVAGGEYTSALVTASDHRRALVGSPQEMQFGDGATAMLVGRTNFIAHYLGGFSTAVDFVDHFRGAKSDFDYAWEERWVREEGYAKLVPQAINAALRKLAIPPESITQLVMPTAFPDIVIKLAQSLGLTNAKIAEFYYDRCGDLGTAHPLLQLASVLQRAPAGERVLVVSFAQGCDVLVFETTGLQAPVEAGKLLAAEIERGREELNYLKYQTFNDLVKFHKGARAEVDRKPTLSMAYRRNDLLAGLVGGACSACGQKQIPASRICTRCGAADTQLPSPFSDRPARILSWSADYLVYGIDPPTYYGIVDFEGGGRLMVNFTDVAPGEIEIGVPVRMVFRVKDYDDRRGYTRYFWKATPSATTHAAVETL